MKVNVASHPNFPSIYTITFTDGTQKLATKNFTPTRTVYSEPLIRYNDNEYRAWNPFRSKLAAAILKNLKYCPIKPNHTILYLGAASGTTSSHISDMIGERGHIYCVEFAPRVMRELVDNVCAFRANMSPILADARFPERYIIFVNGMVDEIYCDIAQPEQTKILIANAKIFLKPSGWIMLIIKAPSIDSTKKPSQIYKREIRILQKSGFKIKEVLNLEPYDKAHAMIIAH